MKSAHTVVADEQTLLNKDDFGHEHIIMISKSQTLVPDKKSLTSDSDPIFWQMFGSEVSPRRQIKTSAGSHYRETDTRG